MIDAFLPMAWALLLATSAAIAVIAALRPLVRRQCGAKATLRLWWILPLALAATAMPKSAVSTAQTEALPYVEVVQDLVDAEAEALVAPPAAPSLPPLREFALAMWLAGALLVTARMLRAQWLFARNIRWGAGKRGALPAQCGPAVVGAIAPRIVLPADFRVRYSCAERKLILLHEVIHLRRRDGLANLAMSLLLALQWFNPLLHWAARAMCRDQESACDAVVVNRHPQALRIYADALLKSHLEMQHPPLVCHWLTYHPTVERVAMLKLHRDMRTKTQLAAALLTAGAAMAGALAYAAVPAKIVIVNVGSQVTAGPDLLATPMASPIKVAVPPVQTVQPAIPARRSGSAMVASTHVAPIPPVQPLPNPDAADVSAALSMPPANLRSVSMAEPDSAPKTTQSRLDNLWNATFNFQKIELPALVHLAETLAKTKISGAEQLREIKVTVSKRAAPIRQVLQVVLSCSGYSLNKTETGFAIEKSTPQAGYADANACIEAGLPAASPKVLNPNWEAANSNLRSDNIDLDEFARLATLITGVEFAGIEQLRGTRVTVPARNSPMGKKLQVVFGCAGYALTKSDGDYAITKAGTPAAADINACIDAGLPSVPPPASADPLRTALSTPLYEVAMDILQGERLLKSSRATLYVGEDFKVRVSENLLLVCNPTVLSGNLYVTCTARTATARFDEKSPRTGLGGMKKIELGQMTSMYLSGVESGTTLQITVNKAAS